MLLLLVAAATIIFIALVLIQRLVFGYVKNITDFIKKLRISERTSAPGDDEMAGLAKAVNELFASMLITRHSIQDETVQLNILLVEDDYNNRILALRRLEQKGHTVTIAENGLQAVEKFKQKRPDVILMDIQMPEMDGFQATTAIREIEKENGWHTPIIALTAHAMEKGDFAPAADNLQLFFRYNTDSNARDIVGASYECEELLAMYLLKREAGRSISMSSGELTYKNSQEPSPVSSRVVLDSQKLVRDENQPFSVILAFISLPRMRIWSPATMERSLSAAASLQVAQWVLAAAKRLKCPPCFHCAV